MSGNPAITELTQLRLTLWATLETLRDSGPSAAPIASEAIREQVRSARGRAGARVLEASLGVDPLCGGCGSRRVPGGGLCARCAADEVR